MGDEDEVTKGLQVSLEQHATNAGAESMKMCGCERGKGNASMIWRKRDGRSDMK